jgi:hypothetical protein
VLGSGIGNSVGEETRSTAYLGLEIFPEAACFVRLAP